jgi:hypothetical protein
MLLGKLTRAWEEDFKMDSRELEYLGDHVLGHVEARIQGQRNQYLDWS